MSSPWLRHFDRETDKIIDIKATTRGFHVPLTALITSFNERYDKLSSSVQEPKTSLEFSQKDIDNLTAIFNETQPLKQASSDQIQKLQADLGEKERKLIT